MIHRKKTFFTLTILAVLGISIGVDHLLPTQSAYAVFPTNATVLDNFNRADTASVGGSTSSSGNLWSNTLLQNSSSPAIGISGNQLLYNGGPDNMYLTTLFGPDSEVSVDVPVLPVAGNYVGLFSRIQDPGSSAFDAYALIYIQPSSGNATWSLRRYTNGASTTLSDISAPVITAGDSVGLEITGTGSSVSLTAYKKSAGVWSSVGSVNDTDPARITSSGYLGLTLSDSVTRLDNFSGGNLVTNASPAAPSLTLPADGATNASSSPQFTFRSTDADSDYLRYKIEICSTSNCSTILKTIDQTNSQTGWSGQDRQGGSAYAGNSSIASSTLATYTYQTPALNPGTQYWWRAYATDPGGTNTFSAASAIHTFSTASTATSPGNDTTAGSPSPLGAYTPPVNAPRLK